MILHKRLPRFGGRNRVAQRRKLRVEFGETALGFEPRSFGCTFPARDEAIPTAQQAGASDKPFARLQPSSIVFLGEVDQRQTGRQFRRALGDVGREIRCDRRGRFRPGPEAPIHLGDEAKRRSGVPAQHGSQRALIAWGDAEGIDRDRKSVRGLCSFGASLTVPE